MLRLQLPKSLAYRDMARVELPRDMILPQRGIWLDGAADYALSD
ncbi:hypothetical protein ACVWZZ_004284 [Bradyrhizobium sp. LM6.10]